MDNKKRNEIILGLTCELFEMMNFSINKAAVEDVAGEEDQAQVLVSLDVENPASLIGFRGKNLAAIQLILSLAVKNKLGDWVRVILDINNYRGEQKTRLEAMTTSLADRVVATGKSVQMANMSSYERRLCHMVLANRDDVLSESEGEGEDRHIVIKLKS